MKVFLFSDRLDSIHGEPLRDDQSIYSIDTIEESPHGLCEVGGRLARCCCLSHEEDRLFIEYVSTPKGDIKVLSSNNITCPNCGYEDVDSWESSDSEDYEECGSCGSVFSYEREVQVTYSSHIVEKNSKITKLT